MIVCKKVSFKSMSVQITRKNYLSTNERYYVDMSLIINIKYYINAEVSRCYKFIYILYKKKEKPMCRDWKIGGMALSDV